MPPAFAGLPAVKVEPRENLMVAFPCTGPACRTLRTSQRDFYPALQRAVADAWRTAEETRERLLEDAAGQIALSKTAFRRVVRLVESRRVVRQNDREGA